MLFLILFVPLFVLQSELERWGCSSCHIFTSTQQMCSEGREIRMLPDLECIGGRVVVTASTTPFPFPLPMLFPSTSTREKAFVLVYGIVHHTGTKRLNQVAWSNSPWGFNTTEPRDYRLTIPVLQRTPLWHSTVHKPFTNTFLRCKTELAPWDFCDGREKIQKSIRHVPY